MFHLSFPADNSLTRASSMAEQVCTTYVHIQNKDIIQSWHAVGKLEGLDTDEMIATYLINLYLQTTKSDAKRSGHCIHCKHSLLSPLPGLQNPLQQKIPEENVTAQYAVLAPVDLANNECGAAADIVELQVAVPSTSGSPVKLEDDSVSNSSEVMLGLDAMLNAEKSHSPFPSTVSCTELSDILSTETSYSDAAFLRSSAQPTSVTEDDIEKNCVADKGPEPHTTGKRKVGNFDISCNSHVQETPGEENSDSNTGSTTEMQACQDKESSDMTANKYTFMQARPSEDCNERDFPINTRHAAENSETNTERDVGNRHFTAVSHNENIQPHVLENKQLNNGDQFRSLRKRKVDISTCQMVRTSASESKPGNSSRLSSEKPAPRALSCASGNSVSGSSSKDNKTSKSSKMTKSGVRKKHGKPVCPECKATFTERNSLKSHMLIHTGEKPFQCLHCDMRFRQKTAMRTHLKQIHSTERPFKCPHCPKDFKLKKSLKSHIICHQPGPLKRPFNCKECPAAFTTNSHLKRHVLIHKGDKPYLCTDCGRSYSQAANLKTHIESRHLKNFRYFCEKCGKGFLFNHELQKHTDIHKDKERKAGLYVCETCGKSLKSYKVLIQHAAMHTDVRPYSCEECEKKFKTRLSLNSHKKSHIVISVKCEVCGKEFNNKHSLSGHMKTHTLMNPVVCECCGKSFNSIISLYNHKKSHSAIRPFVCEMCGKTFKSSAALKMHAKTHVDGRPFCCETCGKNFKSRGVLNVHKKTHNLPKIMFECESCGKAFKRHSSLANHKRIHGCEVLCM